MDDQGKQVKDSLGNNIQVDKMIDLRCELLEIRQFKAANLKASVRYIDNTSQQVIQTFPITSEFIFEHFYATHRGDRRALEKRYVDLIGLRSIPFPTDEQMVYDVGQDLKWRVKKIIVNSDFR